MIRAVTVKRLRRLGGVLFAAVMSLPASGQDIAAFRNGLARPGTVSDATVTVTEYGSAADAVRAYDTEEKPDEIQGYRIRIFFDNGNNARSEALATQKRLRSEIPGIPTFLVYENPSYIVTVGNCISIDEALMLWNRVRKSFDTAFLWRGNIPLEELLREEAVPIPEEGLRADSTATANSVLPESTIL